MTKRFGFLLSTAAATFACSTLSMANETPFSYSNDKTQISQPVISSTIDNVKTASLATPLPSVSKILGPKPQIEKRSEAPDVRPSIPKTENLQKSENPFSYKKSEDPQITQDTQEAPFAPEKPSELVENHSDKKLKLVKAIEEVVTNKIKSRNKLERKDMAAIATFYTDHNFDPLWIKDGYLTPQAKTLIDRLALADEDGLDYRDYTVELPTDTQNPNDLAAFEINLSKALLHYARDAQAGRVIPSSVSRDFKLRPAYPDPNAVMLKLATSADKAAALASYNPTHAGYKALRRELANLRSLTDIIETVIVPAGKSMYKGYNGPRVKILRERLNLPVLADEDPEFFDETLKTAVKAFQTENNLIADGIAGPKTIRVMNGDKVNRIPDIIANMERWRWMARDLGALHVIANIPSYNVTIMKNGNNIHRTRVVVGKTKHKTPIFSDQMEFVVVNPYWNVPYSIASKELLPNIRSNPGYVRSRNYEVLSGSRVVNPTSVNWNENSFKRLRIRQRPGGRNALGNVKFLFPNDYAIYFHDTPSKSLFQRATRAFSHGCVRIHNPFEFGDVLMKQSKGWADGSLKKLIGKKEKWIKLKKDERIPVHIAYFTAVSDADGSISYKSDVYGHNTRLKRALGLI